MTPADNQKDRLAGAVADEGGRRRVVVVVGTRPEAIKMAPVVRALRERPDDFEAVVVSTGQHREMLQQAFGSFGYSPDLDLGLMTHDQTLTGFAATALSALDHAFDELRPEVLLVQGDTVTVEVAAQTARLKRIRVGHVEAGLRSFNDEDPFPEEINRRLTGVLADYHFAPTRLARRNLLAEGIREEAIYVTGNTVVDALQSLDLTGEYDDPALGALREFGRRMVLVTAHRRESHGAPLRSICTAIRVLASRNPDLQIVFPVHPNPAVRTTVDEELSGLDRIHLIQPVGYRDLLRLIDRAFLVISDSGGIQEEAPSFGTPLLILRDVTERPEVVTAGAARLVGTEAERIVEAATKLLEDPKAYRRMAATRNPFGDGCAAKRIAAVLAGEKMSAVDVAEGRRWPRARQRGRPRQRKGGIQLER